MTTKQLPSPRASNHRVLVIVLLTIVALAAAMIAGCPWHMPKPGEPIAQPDTAAEGQHR